MSEFSVEGMGDLQAMLNSLGPRADAAERTALKAAGDLLADAMRENVSVSTVEHLHIRDDIEVSKVKRDDMDNQYVEVGPGKETNWRAKFLEYGTSKMQAEPFAGKAAVEKKQQVVAVMASVLKGEMGL